MQHVSQIFDYLTYLSSSSSLIIIVINYYYFIICIYFRAPADCMGTNVFFRREIIMYRVAILYNVYKIVQILFFVDLFQFSCVPLHRKYSQKIFFEKILFVIKLDFKRNVLIIFRSPRFKLVTIYFFLTLTHVI